MTDNRVENALQEETQRQRRQALAFSLADGIISTPAGWYEVFQRYYQNNALYDALAQLMRVQGLWMQGMKPLRNPAHRAVEFHVAHLWPGALPGAMPITATKKEIIPAIAQVWDWSNWGTQKQKTARHFANLGDLFIKVPARRDAQTGVVDQVFLQVLKAANVIDFQKDARGFMIRVRIDTYQTRTTESGEPESYVRTEVWEKASDRYRVYEHTKAKGTPLSELGAPTINKSIQESFGFDFIPIVHAQFCDVDGERGDNCYVHVLDKIDEANMMATRLHQILFRYNKPTTVVMANAEDKSGRPLPPPRVADSSGNDDENQSVTIRDEEVWEMPGYSKIDQLVPDIKYADALQILQDQVGELETDLPEIIYYQLKDKSDASGRALQTILSGAIDRALEARGNAESALVRAQQMALTIGQLHQLPGFEPGVIGTFEGGEFSHTFAERDVIPLSKKERAETVKTYIDGGMALNFAMKQNGFTDDEISENDKLLKDQRDQENKQLGQLVIDAMRNRDQGSDGSNLSNNAAVSIPDVPA